MLAEAVILLAAIITAGHIIDYRILKNIYLRENNWSLNICCGKTDGGGVNADIVRRSVPNFVLVKDIYNLPFKDRQFENCICSHTIEHVENPGKFYKELMRVSKNVVILVPPIWDLSGMFFFAEHKWQFLTLSTKHKNYLPKKVKLPYSWYHNFFGQRIK